MISLQRWMRLVYIIPIALMSSPVWADCGKCHEKHESACGNPCGHVSHCAQKCEKPPKEHCPKADLDSLHGCMPCDSQELTVTYKVETKHAVDGQFDLVVNVMNDGTRVEQFVIPLDVVQRVEHSGDREYRATISQTLASNYPDRKHFKIEGNVVARSGSTSMSHKTASVHIPKGGENTHEYETVTMTDEE